MLRQNPESGLMESRFRDLLNPPVVAVKTEPIALVKTFKHLDSAIPSGLLKSTEVMR